MTKVSLPEGTEWLDFMTPVPADSPVGKRDVVRILQYEVREGREAGEVVVLPKAFIAKRNECCIYQLELFDGNEDKVSAGASAEAEREA